MIGGPSSSWRCVDVRGAPETGLRLRLGRPKACSDGRQLGRLQDLSDLSFWEAVSLLGPKPDGRVRFSSLCSSRTARLR